jgi:hypothetical protein
LMTIVEAGYGRIASSTIQALSHDRSSAGLLLCIAFNTLLITSGGALRVRVRLCDGVYVVLFWHSLLPLWYSTSLYSL